MEEGLDLALCDEGLDRFAFEHLRIVGDGINRFSIENEEAAVDPAALVAGLFLKGVDLSVLQSQRSETRKGLHTGQRNEFVVVLVKRNRSRNVDIGNAVTIGHAEGLIAVQVLRDSLQTSSSAGRVAGIDQGDAPGFSDRFMHGHLVGVHVERHIRGMQEVVGKILLNDVALVATANDEVIDAVLGVNLQNVPKDGPAANLDHRLGPDNRFFREARAEAASEDYGFHSKTPSANLLAFLRVARISLPKLSI